MSATSVHDTTEHPSSSLVPQTTRLILVRHAAFLGYFGSTLKLCILVHRHLVNRMRNGRADAWTASIPRRERNRPVGGDHQGARHTVEGADQDDEPKLHGAQVPTNQTSSFPQGLQFCWHNHDIYGLT